MDGKVTNGHIPGNSFMTNTDFRSQEYNAAQGQSSSNNIYSSPLKDARELSLKAHDVSLEPMKAGEPNISGSQNVSFFENKKTLKQLVYLNILVIN